MSIDYFVYLKKPENYSSGEFERCCESLGLRAEMHPAFSFREDSGFTPICLTAEQLAANGPYLSGFEFYFSEYLHAVTPKKAPGLLGKLFRKNTAEESPFDAAVKDSVALVELHCGTADSFEVLLAYVFGAYLVKYCGGVFDDPQTGQFFDTCDRMEAAVAEILQELQGLADAGQLRTHRFTGWK